MRNLAGFGCVAALFLLGLAHCSAGAGEGDDVSGSGPDASKDSGRKDSSVPKNDSADTPWEPDDSGSPETSTPSTSDAGPNEGGPPAPTSCTKPADCPGNDQTTTAAVDCVQQQCAITCKGENYDVDQVPGNGCEVADSPGGNHVQASATDLGSEGACDANPRKKGPGKVPSDTRVHNPPVTGMLANGSAPDWFKVVGTGSGTTCLNDVAAQLNVFGSRNLNCYELFAQTDKSGAQTCTTDASGVCEVTAGSTTFGGGYSSGSTIYFRVQKLPNCTGPEAVTYEIDYHL